MKFQHKSKQELATMNLVDPGTYEFYITEAKDRVSKAGSEMIELKICIIDSQNKDRFIFDYLLESMAFKLEHFCEATGLYNKYLADELTAFDCIGKRGILELIIQKSKDPMFGDKNSVKDYIVRKSTASTPELQKVVDAAFNDEIPF